MNRHTYRYADMVETLPKMNRINQIRANPDAPIVPKGHKKQINIWDEGSQKPLNEPDLKNYPSDVEMATVWDSGIVRAQELCREVGMEPASNTLTEKQRMQYYWFFTPHRLNASLKKKMEDTMCEDENEDMPLEDNEEDEDDGNNPADGGTEEAIQNVQSQLEDDEHDRNNPADEAIPAIKNEDEREGQQKFSLKITIPGNKELRKSTLVALLNNNPDGKLSKDRLTRVASVKPAIKNSSENNLDSTETSLVMDINYRKELSLNCDFPVFRKTDGFSYALGRLIKSGKSRGKIEYKKPANLDNEKERNINVVAIRTSVLMITHSCISIRSNNERSHIKDIIMGVRLMVNDSENYILDDDDKASLDSIIEEYKTTVLKKKKKKNVVGSSGSVKAFRPIQSMADYERIDGTVRSVVEPTTTTGETRRSSRTRTVIVTDFLDF